MFVVYPERKSIYINVHMCVSMFLRPTGIVVDARSSLAARAAKDLQESVLYPLSQEMFLNITYLHGVLQDFSSAPPSGIRE